MTPTRPRFCPRCTMEVPESAVFCGSCGAKLPPREPICAKCGLKGSPTAAFCGRCGAPFAQAATVGAPAASALSTTGGSAGARFRGGRGTASRGLGIAVGVVAIVALAAGGAYLLRGDGDDESADSVVRRESAVEVLGEAGTSATGLSMRAPLRLTHPDGAVAQVPGSEYVFSDWVDFRKVDPGDIGDGWEAHGSAWKFESRAGITTREAIAVAIPDAGAPADAVVVALTSLGGWAEVPASRETGTFRLDVTDVPAPWLVLVATPREATYLPGDGPGEAMAVEALYWSDREAWQQQELAWIAEQDLSATAFGEPLFVSRTAAQPRTYQDVKADLDLAIRLLGGARAIEAATQAGLGIGLPGAASSPQGVLAYQAGIAKLTAVRREWVNSRYEWARAAGSEGDVSVLRYDDAQTMDQAIESALARYAPWGVELIDHLLRSGYLAALDLRVLAPYGETYFTDVKLPAGAIDAIEGTLAEVDTAGSRDEARFLRLYSTRAVEDTSLIDYLKDWKTEAFVRYAPIALWVLGLTPGGPLLVGFALVDQLLSWYQNTETVATDQQLYTQVQHYSTALGTTSLVVDAVGDVIRTTHVAETAIASRTVGVGQLIYAIGLSYAVANTDWYLLKDVREVTEGSRSYCIQGRCNWFYSQNIPPIQVVASVRGDAPLAAGAYPAARAKVMTWSMAFRGGAVRLEDGRPIWSPDLHAIFHREIGGATELWAQADTHYTLTGKEALNALTWEPYTESRWPDVLIRTTPDVQAIRVGVPRTYLEAVEREFSIPPGSPIEDYGLVLTLNAPADGGRNIFQLTEAAERLPTDAQDMVYFSVVLTRDDSLDLDGLEEPYSGQVQVAEMTPLRRTLTGRIYAGSQDEEDRLEFPIEFTPLQPVRQLDKEDIESPRVHFIDVLAEAKPVVYRGTTSQGLPIELLIDFQAKTWEIQKFETHVPEAACGDPESDVLSRRNETSADWGSARAGSQVPADNERYAIAQFALWVTEGSLVGNALAWAPMPPAVAALQANEEADDRIESPGELWEAERFATLDPSKGSVSGEITVPYSGLFACPPVHISFTASR